MNFLPVRIVKHALGIARVFPLSGSQKRIGGFKSSSDGPETLCADRIYREVTILPSDEECEGYHSYNSEQPAALKGRVKAIAACSSRMLTKSSLSGRSKLLIGVDSMLAIGGSGFVLRFAPGGNDRRPQGWSRQKVEG